MSHCVMYKIHLPQSYQYLHTWWRLTLLRNVALYYYVINQQQLELLIPKTELCSFAYNMNAQKHIATTTHRYNIELLLAFQ